MTLCVIYTYKLGFYYFKVLTPHIHPPLSHQSRRPECGTLCEEKEWPKADSMAQSEVRGSRDASLSYWEVNQTSYLYSSPMTIHCSDLALSPEESI